MTQYNIDLQPTKPASPSGLTKIGMYASPFTNFYAHL